MCLNNYSWSHFPYYKYPTLDMAMNTFEILQWSASPSLVCFRYSKGEDPANLVSVDPETGKITTASILDRESPYAKDGIYVITVNAVDCGMFNEILKIPFYKKYIFLISKIVQCVCTRKPSSDQHSESQHLHRSWEWQCSISNCKHLWHVPKWQIIMGQCHSCGSRWGPIQWAFFVQTSWRC